VDNVGYRSGWSNPKSACDIRENWLSPEYALDMRQVVLRETIGQEKVETRDIVPGEPDPALFQIPPGYITRVVR
jgi:hypothetical protein